jgi:hypothetical protein
MQRRAFAPAIVQVESALAVALCVGEEFALADLCEEE